MSKKCIFYDYQNILWPFILGQLYMLLIMLIYRLLWLVVHSQSAQLYIIILSSSPCSGLCSFLLLVCTVWLPGIVLFISLTCCMPFSWNCNSIFCACSCSCTAHLRALLWFTACSWFFCLCTNKWLKLIIISIVVFDVDVNRRLAVSLYTVCTTVWLEIEIPVLTWWLEFNRVVSRDLMPYLKKASFPRAEVLMPVCKWNCPTCRGDLGVSKRWALLVRLVSGFCNRVEGLFGKLQLVVITRVMCRLMDLFPVLTALVVPCSFVYWGVTMTALRDEETA